jgi:hypothetical protein
VEEYQPGRAGNELYGRYANIYNHHGDSSLGVRTLGLQPQLPWQTLSRLALAKSQAWSKTRSFEKLITGHEMIQTPRVTAQRNDANNCGSLERVAAWREVPAGFGSRHTVYTRFHKSRKAGVWPQVVTIVGFGTGAMSAAA